tara:strand:- start:3720 stop:4046 length:327 start_codon:yes stop_codon:yes gene_type:complete
MKPCALGRIGGSISFALPAREWVKASSVDVDFSAVIAVALRWVTKDCICPRNVLESLRDTGIIWVKVGMKFFDQSPVGSFYLRFVVVTRHAENLVEALHEPFIDCSSI